MATNYSQDGQTVTWTNDTGSDVSSGDPVVLGSQLGVAITDIADGDIGGVALEGVWELPKATGSAIDFGAVVDYDDSASKIDGDITAAEGDLLGCGVAWADAGSDDETVMVKINASGATIQGA
ncbi:MAG: DUF2190 family protein [Halomonas sp.]